MDPIEPITYVASTSVSTTNPLLPSVGFDIFAIISAIFGGGDGVVFSGGFLNFLSWLWSFYAILAYIVSIILLIIYIYASVKRNLYANLRTQALRDQEKLYDEHFRGSPRNSRLTDVLNHSESDNPNDWKLAIIEADIILDGLLKDRGYAGNSLGERLKSVSPHQMASLSDAWEAHKVRNRIAHDGTDFVLTKRVAQETIARYQRVFTEFGVT